MKNSLTLISLVLFSLVLFGCLQTEQQQIFKESDARAFVLDDLNSKYPSADVKEILEITPLSTNDSWQIKARVTFNYTSACPVRMNVYYDYPRKGFIETPPEYVTRDCTVCNGVETCILGTPEEAIIASHTLSGSEAIVNFIGAHANAQATAKFYSEYLDPIQSNKYSNVWVVKWTSDTTNYGLIVLVSNEAQVLGVIQATKQETI